MLAGGTDLMPQTQSGKVNFKPVLMNIRRVAELHGIAETAGLIRIGALTTMTELLQSALVRERLEEHRANAPELEHMPPMGEMAP